MKVIWTWENITNNPKNYSKLNIVLLLSSVRLWKKHHPNDETILYCDAITNNLISSLGVSHFWDDVVIFNPINGIDKSIFWAASKLQILSQIDEPVLVLDNDTLAYQSLTDVLDFNEVWVHALERGVGYYPTYYDNYIKRLSIQKRWKPNSVNVSFLNLPNPIFTKKYANLSLDIMREFTKMEVPNSQYLIFAEQLILRDLLDSDNIPVNSIVKNYWECGDRKWGEYHQTGKWDINDSEIFIKHIGPMKRRLKLDESEKDYKNFIKSLVFSINFSNFHLTQFLNSNEYLK